MAGNIKKTKNDKQQAVTSKRKGNNGGGRVKAIDSIDLDTVTALASQNIDNYKIAEALNICEATFYKLMRTEPTFKEAYEQGMENRKYELEKALFKRAQGFTTEETQTVVTDDPEKGRIIKNTTTRKNYVPDSVALIFALKNRYGDKYKDKIETTTNVNINIKHIETLSNEELMQIAETSDIQADYSIE